MSKITLKTDEEKSIKEFDKYFELDQEKEHKEIQDLYNYIKKLYELKFKDDEMKIKIEKMNLERNIGKYQGALRKSGLSLLIGVFGIMIQLILPEVLKIFNINKPIINVTIMVIVMIYAMHSMGKDFDKQRPKDLMKYVALKVLEDMEKESLEYKIEQEKEANRKELLQQISQEMRSKNNMKNAVLPAMLEIAATSVVKENVIGRLLKKVKRK